ncbi:MAG TPA: O-antigen ligase domain-containing protein, partial [Bradyrhizobium sp.]|nr:O-antigen ligase domain-containing protein [Bradyrhizobium sp.]
MAYTAVAGSPAASAGSPRLLAFQRALVWLVGASGAIVFIEPSPYEIMTLGAAALFCATGVRMRLALVPLLLLLALINIGYSIGAIPFYDKPEVVSWIATSWYMAATVMFFAMVMSEDTLARLEMLRGGLIVGAMIASIAAIAGYLNLVPAGHDLLTLYGRARGTFKDPNVIGAFLILPALFSLQSVVADRFAKALRNAVTFVIMALAILFAFSRAAWGGLAVTAAFMLATMVLTSRSQAQRSRIIVISIAAVVLLVLLI